MSDSVLNWKELFKEMSGAFTAAAVQGQSERPPAPVSPYGGDDQKRLAALEETVYGAKKYSTATPETSAFHSGVSSILSQYTGVSTTLTNDYVNQIAQQWYDQHGEWPDPVDLMGTEGFAWGATKLPTNSHVLPPFFAIQEEDGTLTWMDNRLSTGPAPVTSMLPWVNGITEIANPNNPDYDWYTAQNTTTLPRYLFQAILGAGRPATSGGGGGVGVQYDKKQVMEAINNQWRSLMLQEPSDTAGLADSYITAAQAFRRRGGNLDLDTWVRGKIRDTGRYRTLYDRKPSFQSEEQYINQYTQAAGQFGLNERWTSQQIESGMTSGAGIAGFTERVGGTSEARLSNMGGWSQRFAQHINSMGAAGRMN